MHSSPYNTATAVKITFAKSMMKRYMRQMMRILLRSKAKYKCLEENIKEFLYRMLSFFSGAAMITLRRRMSFMIE